MFSRVAEQVLFLLGYTSNDFLVQFKPIQPIVTES